MKYKVTAWQGVKCVSKCITIFTLTSVAMSVIAVLAGELAFILSMEIAHRKHKHEVMKDLKMI